MTHDQHTAAGIVVRDLVVTYPSRPRAVDGISLKVPFGGVLALIGSNGAGKSTTMRVLSGGVPATSGRVLVDGNDMTTRSGLDRARAVLGYCPDTGGLPPAMTPRECIGLALATSGAADRWPAAIALAERLELVRVLDTPTGTFSHGMARRVSVLLATLTSRKVLLLDEPFDGVDALGSDVVVDIVAEARDRGAAVVVSTHNLDFAALVCDQVAVMSGGRIVHAVHGQDLIGRRGQRRYAEVLAAARTKAAA